MDAGVFGLALFDRGGRAEARKVMPLLGAPARRLLCAWAAAAPLFMLQSCLGLGFDLNRSHVTFEGPVLPDFLGEVTLRNLALDGATVDVALRRSGLQVVVDVLDRRASVRVATTS